MNSQNNESTQNIAIIGSGISGLTSGYILSQKHNVTLFEANDYLGGHTNTVYVDENDIIISKVINTGKLNNNNN